MNDTIPNLRIVDPAQPSAELPQNLEAEAALLGALMIDNRLIDSVLDRCGPDDMADALHGRIFAMIVKLQASGKNANPVTLAPLFKADPAMMELGGPGYLATLTMNSAALLAARDFASQIRDLALLRRIIAVGQDIVKRASDTSKDIMPAQNLADAEAALFQLNEAVAGSAPQVLESDWSDTIQMVLDRQQRIDAGLMESGMMCSTICDFNTITAGLLPGWLTILAGRPAMGKTAVATSAAIGFAKAGHGVGFISLEMDSLALGQRITADMTHLMGKPVAYPAIREGRLVKQDIDHIMLARDAMAKLPLRMVDVSRMTLSKVAKSIKRMKAKMAANNQKLDIVFIDYLTLIDPDTPSKNRSVDVGTISRGLKALAKQEQVSIIALAQLNRGVEAREDKRPNLSDLRDSGEIEQDADNVIFLYRDEYYLKLAQPDPEKPDAHMKWQAQMDAAQGRIEFIAAKVRAGEARTCKGYFFGQNQAVRGSDFYRGRDL